MNYLAHLYLAENRPESLIGNLMGDFVKGTLDGDSRHFPILSPERLHGIRLHRRVDSFTDAHPVFRQSKRRLRPELRRYGGIIIDILYDHFLAQNWSQYSAIPLDRFSQSVYVILQNHYHAFPARMQRSVRYMIAHDLLLSYRDVDGIGRALRGVEGRLKRPSGLGLAVEDLEHHYAAFGADFEAFFPALVAHAEQHKTSEEQITPCRNPIHGRSC